MMKVNLNDGDGTEVIIAKSDEVEDFSSLLWIALHTMTRGTSLFCLEILADSVTNYDTYENNDEDEFNEACTKFYDAAKEFLEEVKQVRSNYNRIHFGEE